MGKVLQKCKLIAWDICILAHKKSLEALDRSLQDLCGTRPFGNALILLAGDFRPTLPVRNFLTSIAGYWKWKGASRFDLRENFIAS
ncbi:ATP-dependent DNA helicase [Trichonephila inaurata madagascariensis]|uniref:ATP-dependent DNA helicase n=1 Tax=Trichonephila inaurata madagascariensis TaxID=2747483 RepID=A0A8X6XV45_9ARAC|nr:ATP-dependent DNA helicase [Trichonephila inaurata madagascariensis]